MSDEVGAVVLREIEESLIRLEEQKAILQHELESIDLKLREERARYKKLSNARLPVSQLPIELLISILSLCQRQESTKPRTIPCEIIASHVSNHWREVALSAPLMWNKIFVQLRPSARAQASELHRLQVYLDRSGDTFLDLTIICPNTTTSISPWLSLIAPHTKRWKRLALLSRSPRTEDTIRYLSGLAAPSLDYLSLTFGRCTDEESTSHRTQFNEVCPRILLQGTPSLSFVRLAGSALGQLHPPLTAVETLHLDGWSRNYMSHLQFQNLVGNLPCLRNLSLNKLCVHHARDPLVVIIPTTLPSLVSLRICTSLPLHYLLSFLDMPRLESLTLHEVGVFNVVPITTLRSLTLDGCPLNESDIVNIMSSFPDVAELSIDDSLPQIYSMLTPGRNSESDKVPWPRLHTISIRSLQPLDIPQFVGMILRRSTSEKPIAKICLDRRSRTVLRNKQRFDWIQDRMTVERREHLEDWPPGLSIEDLYDFFD